VSVAPGTLIANKYRTERVIGEGGMGIVVAARHVELGRRVAIKLVRKEALAAGSVERLLREARAAALIESEHVGRVLDVGRTKAGEPYLVLEYLDGQDLHARLASGPPARVADAVSWILQACEGHAAAHARGFVHRDLKPSNLFLARSPDGREIVKLLDFGLAKSVDADDGRITATGAILGSPSYMSPEHLSGRALDARSDVWSLGVTLYELLTRAVPFPGNTTPEICAAVLSLQPVPIGSHRHDVPADLAAVIEACLVKDPAGRPRDVADLAARLAPFSDDGPARASRVAQTLASTPSEELPAPHLAAFETPTHLVSSIDAPPKARASATLAAAVLVVAACAALIVAFVVLPRKQPIGANVPSAPLPQTPPDSSQSAVVPAAIPLDTVTIVAPPATSKVSRPPRPRPSATRTTSPSASPLERF
jgi:serine/threonine protein kinase